MRLVLTLAVSLLIPLPLLAQGVLGTPMGLVESDLDRIEAALKQVLDEKRLGDTVEWSNPETGTSGTATAQRFYQKDGLECVEVATVTSGGEAAGVRPVTLPLCQTAEGWKLAF